MSGTIKEASPAFQLLHQNLNWMSVSLSRFDLARVLQAVRNLDDQARETAAARRAVMESAPLEVKQIYEESLHVFVLALVFNSLFIFVLAGLCIATGTLLRVGFLKVKDAVMKRVADDSSLVFFSPEATSV
jgi:hypothetical protein